MSMTLTRQELYDRVWAEPIAKLCKNSEYQTLAWGKRVDATASQCRRAAIGSVKRLDTLIDDLSCPS